MFLEGRAPIFPREFEFLLGLVQIGVFHQLLRDERGVEVRHRLEDFFEMTPLDESAAVSVGPFSVAVSKTGYFPLPYEIAIVDSPISLDTKFGRSGCLG